MKIHEYQAKELCRKYGVPVPDGGVASSHDEAIKVAKKISKFPVMVKAQIHAGGRGKGGGIKLADSLDGVVDNVKKIVGSRLVTNQTGPDGQKVLKVLIEQSFNIKKEFYLSIISDRSTAMHVIIASEAGGMEIEAVAEKRPDKIVRVYVDPILGIQNYHCRKVVFGLNVLSSVRKDFIKILFNLYSIFVDCDCVLVEVNPIVLTIDNELIALDTKVDIDSNALYRHDDIVKMRDIEEEDPFEVEASKYSLNYINLKGNGNIGNMVNGAGLAMATMDIIKLAGAEPANFLDVGGGASSEMIENGLKIILSNDAIKGILINIFGGILRCDVLASGVVQAAEKIGLNVPVVVRMEGTNVDEGRKIFSKSKFEFIMATSLMDAAQQITKIAFS